MFSLKRLPLLPFILLLAFYGCGPEKPVKTEIKKTPPKISKLVKPKNGLKVTESQIPVEVNIAPADLHKVDSIAVFMKSKRLISLYPNEKAMLPVADLPIGKQQLLVSVYKSDGKLENKIANLTIFSDVVPEISGFEIVKEYPHNTGSYTQGLVFHEGYLYESTGQRGESKLLKVELETGDFMQVHDLPNTYFGEGLTLWNDKLIQITWTSSTGFVYNLESFELERSFSYSGQGWGLTHDGTHLIMSNGTNEIVFLHPETQKPLRSIQVSDNTGPVTELNELEYINGEIWANYYAMNVFKVIRIDPSNGKVLGYINFTGILDSEDRHPTIDVFNGIAYDTEDKRLFVTGKYWPKLYEVKIVDLN